MAVMEWIPCQQQLRPTRQERALTAELEQKVAKTFQMLDTDNSGELTMPEVKRCLIALEVEEEEHTCYQTCYQTVQSHL
jgi:Ca2+-binding EF-hand superfamily protein